MEKLMDFIYAYGIKGASLSIMHVLEAQYRKESDIELCRKILTELSAAFEQVMKEHDACGEQLCNARN